MSQGKRPDASKERFWRGMMRQRQESGLSVQAFCLRHELSIASWYYWQRTLRERDSQSVQFTPVHIATVTSNTDAATGLELLLSGGRRIRVGADFDAATLQRLLAVLEDQPC